MKKIFLFGVFLCVSAAVAAQKLSSKDFEFLANGVKESGEVYVITTREQYVLNPTEQDNKKHVKEVQQRLELLRNFGTGVEHKTTRTQENTANTYTFEDEYHYTPNKGSALYRDFEVRMEKERQRKLTQLRLTMTYDPEKIFSSKRTISLTDMKSTGSVLWWDTWWKKKRFIWKDDVHWSGLVKNGKVHGEGEGYYVNPNRRDRVIFFKGKYDEGRPMGTFIQCEMEGEEKNLTFEISPFEGGVALLRYGNTYRVISDDYGVLCNPIHNAFSYDGAIVEFHDGYVFITYKWLKLRVDKHRKAKVLEESEQNLSKLLDDSIAARISKFTTHNILNGFPSDFNNNDFRNSILKIFETLRDFYDLKWEQCLPGVVQIWNFYEEIGWAAFTLNYTPETVTRLVRNDAEKSAYIYKNWDFSAETIGKDIERVRQLLANPQFKLKNAAAVAAAKKKLDQLDNARIKEYDEIKAIRKSRMAAHEAKDADYKNRLSKAVSSAEVDWGRSTSPSGEFRHAVLGGYWYYEKDGKIEFKINGAVIPTLEYNVECESNGKVLKYTSAGNSYNSKNAMIQGHLKRYK